MWKTLLSTEIRFRHFVSSNPSLQPYINETTKFSSPILIPDCRRGQSYLFTSNPSPSPTPYLYTCTDIKWSDSGTACKWTAKFRRGKVFAGWNSHDKGGVVRVTSFASHGSKCRSTRFENTFPRWTLVSTLVRSVWIGGRGKGGEISSNRMERYWKKGKWKFGRAPLAEFIHFSSLPLLPPLPVLFPPSRLRFATGSLSSSSLCEFSFSNSSWLWFSCVSRFDARFVPCSLNVSFC